MTGPPPAVAAVRSAVRASLEVGAGGPAAGDLVLVACSGGADSLALAAAVAFLAPRVGLRAGAVTVDHGLQEGSARRAEDVALTCHSLGLDPVEVATVRVTGGGGPEGAARRVRRDALLEVARRRGAHSLLLGHSRDDQAETVLLGLARGSGARSLAGMAAVTGPWRRPLLDLPRSVLAQACTAAGLHPWHDPHNDDPAYSRVRARHTVLPVLEAELGPGVTAALARTAALLRDDADALDDWAEQVVLGSPGEGVAVAAVEGLPPAVRRRVLRSVALAAGCPPGALAAGHLGALDALLTDWHGQGPLDLPGRVTATRVCGRLRFLPAPT